MNLLESQKELIEDTDSKIIIFLGGYGAGNTTALAAKCLSVKHSLAIDLDYDLIRKTLIPTFQEVLSSIDYKLNRTDLILKTKNSTVHFDYYDRLNKTNKLNAYKLDAICFDNIGIFDCDNPYIAERLFQIARVTAKQVILSVNQRDVKEKSFIKSLAKTETVITASLFNNPHLPEDYIKELKSYIKSYEDSFNCNDYLNGKF